MDSNRTGPPPTVSLFWPAAFFVAACLTLGLVGEAWWYPAAARTWQALAAAAAFAVTAVLGYLWHAHARAARRLNSAVEAYAEREIARAQRRRPA